MSAEPIRLVHMLRDGEPVCPNCGQGLEEDGGSVTKGGSYDWGPLWWHCEDCGYDWGFA